MISWFWEHTVPLPAKSVRHRVSIISDLELPMARLLTPWRVFFHALQKQKSKTHQKWLRRWLFTHDEAGLIPGHRNHTAKSSSLEEREKITARLFTAKRKWPGTFH
jgi:hypothetical protein